MRITTTFLKEMRQWHRHKLKILTLFVMSLTGQIGLAQVTGSTCDNPLLVISMPFSDSGNTGTYGNAYGNSDVPPTASGAVTDGTGAVNYLGNGNDVVYSYTAGSNGSISINTTHSGSSSWNALWVFTGCPFTSTVGYHTATSGTTRSIPNLPVTAGQTYYIVISNWDAGDMDYTINITGTQIADPSACLPPINYIVEELEADNATISWEAWGDEPEEGYEWELFDEDEISIDYGVVLPEDDVEVTVNGLDALTTYTLKVKSLCDITEESGWSEITFTTLCNAVTTLPYTENFDTYGTGTD